jgi:membrane carboxypeptidase/penicillin-binding protein
MTDHKNGKGFKAGTSRNEAQNAKPSQNNKARPHYPKPRPIGKEKVRIIRDDGGAAITVQGQTAKAIRALVLAGKQGVTAQEVAGWAYRFAAYCHELRKLGLDIETVRETHEGGWHGRHVLHTAVRLEPVH